MAMTETQEEVIKQLIAKGWKALPVSDPSIKGGPLPIADPSGERYLVMPDGTLVKDSNPKE